MAIDRIVNPGADDEEPQEVELEATLRPRDFKHYIGQERLKKNIKLAITAAKKRGEPLDHVLLHGPPGLGKTTMANVIAHEMGAQIRVTSGPAIERAGDLASLLTNLQDGDILFIDEIHRLNRTVEEVLYSAMEDFKLDIMMGKGPSRAFAPVGSAAVHHNRRYHAHRLTGCAAARPFRHDSPAGVL